MSGNVLVLIPLHQTCESEVDSVLSCCKCVSLKKKKRADFCVTKCQSAVWKWNTPHVHVSSCCFQYNCYLLLFSFTPTSFSSLFISLLFCCFSLSLSPPFSPACLSHGCHLLKVPAASDPRNVIKFQKNARNASCPLPIFQGPVYARMLFLQVSTFKPPPPTPYRNTSHTQLFCFSLP